MKSNPPSIVRGTARSSEVRIQQRACALIIAGLDPSAGAGIAADLRMVRATGSWGCAVLAVITVQSTAGLVSATAVDPGLVLAQAREVLAHQRIRVIKTGALGSSANVRAVCTLVGEHPEIPVVIDPVMIATRSPSGARLLDPEALDAMRQSLALATVVTPNLDEAEALLEMRITGVEGLVAAARGLVRAGARAALVKGGHLTQGPAVDVLAIGRRVIKMIGPRLAIPPFHGGGCSLASLIAGHIASLGAKSDEDIVEAVRRARRQLRRSMRRATDIGDGLLVLPA
ncbi:MAG: hydroxymethylpyrimidine/phosphomethylpyrimidine kinase [Deltaproteobacteria bacterium]|nr:hydroxymethylpyrimidine/phosphomethylpyrimidine kinase [Deltaproteobacteria bacterium]